MTTYRWNTNCGITRYARAGRTYPYGCVFYRPDDSVAHVAVIYTQFAQAVSLGAFNTEVAARATIEAVIPLYLSETDL